MNVLFFSAWIPLCLTQGFTGPNSLRLLKIIILTRQPLCPFKNACLHTELQLLVHKGTEFPRGAVTLSSNQTILNIELATAAGDHSSYPGNSCAYSAVFFHMYIYNILKVLHAHLKLNYFTLVMLPCLWKDLQLCPCWAMQIWKNLQMASLVGWNQNLIKAFKSTPK